MNYAKLIDSATVLYSCCSGYNFYFWDNRRNCEVFQKIRSVVLHVKREDEFYIIPFPDDLREIHLADWVELIRKPVDLKHYIWPVDIIALPDSANANRYALVFPMRSQPEYGHLSDLLADDKQLGWDRPWVKRFIENLLEAWRRFDNSRYAYHEFSADNMFYQKDSFDVMFDFSFSTHKTESLFDAITVNRKRITPDFADSFYYTDERQNRMDLASDYYSMAVILFKLMIGLLPYQGSVIEHEPNINELEHKNWLRVYHRNPYFIFDVADSTNHIGGETGFAKDDIFVERWESLSQPVRNMFQNVFRTANVLRAADELAFYSPQQWTEALFGKPIEVKLLCDDGVSATVQAPVEAAKPQPKVVAATVRADKAPAGGEYGDSGQKKTILVAALVGTLRVELERRLAHDTALCPCGSGMPYEQCCGAPAGDNKAPVSVPAGGYFDVILTSGSNQDKVVAIKVIREITGLRLLAAKEMFESLPCPVVQGVSEELAKRIQAELLLVNAKTKLGANTAWDEELEKSVWSRMKGNWQSRQ